ncbi:hypothetical protein [Salinibaculum salinum]|uniref:hypothetical protein n=1 Tax=Salinibaculum salinum TaxID=3131996 RepID=UPI0030EC0FAC
MTRCPACDSAVGDRTVCPACGTGIEREQAHQKGGRQYQSADHRQRQSAEQPRQQRPAASDEGRQATNRRRSAGRPPLPSGIKLLCGLLVLSGIGSLFVGLQLQSIGQTAGAYGASAAGNSMGTTALVVLAFGVGELVAAAGLWTRKSWGWTAGMAVSGSGILTSGLLMTNSFTSGIGLMGLLLNAGLGWYIYNQRWVFRDRSRRGQQQTQPQQRRQYKQ